MAAQRRKLVVRGKGDRQFEVVVASDQGTVWINADDGSSVGRFSRRFGIDLHTTATEQLAGASQCLFCTHTAAGPEEWKLFTRRLHDVYGVQLPNDLIDL